ncbi:FAD-dependent oxidoreductase [Rhodocaloribacter sp.]
MPHVSDEPLDLIGAGLAGSLLSILLARRGFEVRLFEARPDLRAHTVDGGRSINLALSARGLHALAKAGIVDDILPLTIPMRGRLIHDLDGTTHFVPYGQRPSEVIRSVSRAELNRRLMSAAEATGRVHIRFETRCTGIDFPERRLHLRDEAHGREETPATTRVIGCDGAGSAVRTAMLRAGAVRFEPDFIAHGYKELTIPPAPDGGRRIEKHALHIWPRRDFMLIALPNLDGSFTCTLFLRREGRLSFAALATEADVRSFFEAHFPDAVPLIPHLTEEFFENPVGTLGTVRCEPWHFGDLAVILGDAAHAIVPFFGQGMNCAFEDCVTLDACIADEGMGWEQVFERFEGERKPNADAIATLSLRNFIEMRDRVADPKFLLRKKLEFELERRHPGVFIPAYSMVSFHRIPYAEVLRRSEIQERILDELLAGAASLDEVDGEKADALIRAELEPL